MFVCIELDTKDVILWNKLELALTRELGCSNIIWGASGKALRLPNNLFNIPATEGAKLTCSNMNDKVKAIIESVCGGPYVMIVMPSVMWAWAEETKTKSSTNNLNVRDIEVVRSE